MLQAWTVHVEHHHDEVKLFCLRDLEDVHIDQLHNKVPALIRRYLQSIHAQRQEYFSEAVFGVCLLVQRRLQLVLVIAQHLLGYEHVGLALVVLQLEQQNFVVLA